MKKNRVYWRIIKLCQEGLIYRRVASMLTMYPLEEIDKDISKSIKTNYFIVQKGQVKEKGSHPNNLYKEFLDANLDRITLLRKQGVTYRKMEEILDVPKSCIGRYCRNKFKYVLKEKD